MSVCWADTSGDVPIRLDVAHQDSARLPEPPSAVLAGFAGAFLVKHGPTVVVRGPHGLRIRKSIAVQEDFAGSRESQNMSPSRLP